MAAETAGDLALMLNISDMSTQKAPAQDMLRGTLNRGRCRVQLGVKCSVVIRRCTLEAAHSNAAVKMSNVQLCPLHER